MSGDHFIGFPKIPRLSRECVITEKLDGTNAAVCIADLTAGDSVPENALWVTPLVGLWAQSRTRIITVTDDNYGFAKWTRDHAEELLTLGRGHHYGEWWGQGIQRNYGLKEKRFSLFNVARWKDEEARPKCCGVVPMMYSGPFDTQCVERHVTLLREQGSYAAPGFTKPEGVIVYHTAARQMFKKTLEKDEEPKGAQR